jgi:arabinofuranosyltransferase
MARSLTSWLPVLLTGALGYVLCVCAWQADDAFITYRTVANAWEGHGLTWNPGVRVQTYTHPLWMALAWVCHGVTGETYFSVLALAWILTLVSAALLVRLANGDVGKACLALLGVGTSAAFVDYSVSGLENPLLGLLLGVFVWIVTRDMPKRLVQLALVAAAVGLTRLDALLLVAPVVAHVAWLTRPRLRALQAVVVGFAPFWIWELFCLVYYGSLVPNSAWAKLNVAIPASELVGRGIAYLTDSLVHDPVTLLATLACGVFVLVRGDTRRRLCVVGVVLYLLYVIRVGGDFMSGRFLSAPLVLAVASAVSVAQSSTPTSRTTPRTATRHRAIAVALLVYGFAWPGSRWLSGADFGDVASFGATAPITDERAYYYPTTGLLRVWAARDRIAELNLPTPPHAGALLGSRFAHRAEPVALQKAVGFFGYFAGPGKTIVDIWAICDPLLARIPFRPQPGTHWRMGHFERRVPAGYLESLREDENRLAEHGLAEVYDALRRVTRGNLFTATRWRDIWRLHSGYFDAALQNPSYL